MPLPIWIERKKAIVSVKNNDNKCFQWAIRSAIYPADNNPCRPSKYPKEDSLDWSGITFPTPLEQISIFEKNNGYKIAVYGCRESSLFPIRFADGTPDIHLFYFKDHYSWVKHPQRLLNNMTNKQHKQHICYRCMQNYSSDKILQDHKQLCPGHTEVAKQIEMPKNKELFYTDFKKQLPVPYVMYADFEALITPAGHEVCSYGFITIRQDNKVITPPQIYSDDHAARKFLDAIFKEQEKIRKLLMKQRHMDLSPEEENDFLNAEICHICENS